MKWQTVLQQLSPLPVAIGLSLLFSLYSVVMHPLLNNDAYSYLRAAQVFQESGLQEVLSIYGWYGYSILFASLDPWLPGDLLQSAQIFNALSYALLTGSFILLCRELHPWGSLRLQWFAALAILSYPEINEMRYFLIRDIAYWAFSLLSMTLLIRYARHPQIRTAVLWCASLFVAIAFRLEGLLMLAIVPVVMCLPGTVISARSGLRLLGVLLAGISLIWILSMVAGIRLLDLMQFAYRYYLPLLFNLGDSIRDTTGSLTQVLFTTDNFPGADNLWQGGIVIGFAYLFTVMVNLVYAFSMPLTLLLAWGYSRGYLHFPATARAPFMAYLGSALLALLLFMFIMHFLTQRYAVLACLLLLALIPGLLDHLYLRALESGSTLRVRQGIAVFSLYFLIDSMFSFGYSNTYIEDAIQWSRQELPDQATLYTNHFALAYHSHKVPDFDLISRDATLALSQAQSGDYLVLEVKHANTELQNLLDDRSDLELLNVFSNNRNDQLRAYLVLPYNSHNQ